MTLDFKTSALERNALDVTQIVELATNIGYIGQAPDFSKNSLRNPLQDQHPLLNWLMQTPLSIQMRNAGRQGLAAIHKDAETGEWMIMAPYTVGTLEPKDTTGACCWVPLEIAKCNSRSPLRLLCLKDCEDLMDNLVNKTRFGGSNDLIGYFLRQGESVKDARVRMAKTSMAFFTARNIILGHTDYETATLKPFHGLFQVMQSPGTIQMDGNNILGVFDSLRCRLQVLGDGNYVVALHPLTYQAVDEQVQPGRFDRLPSGWNRSATGELSYHNIRFIQDKIVPVNLDEGTGEAWVIEGNNTGVYMGTDLIPANDFIRHGFASTDDPSQGCASECDFYYNYGGVVNNNSNHLAVITDIPLSSACVGNTLVGLDDLVQPTTLVPMV